METTQKAVTSHFVLLVGGQTRLDMIKPEEETIMFPKVTEHCTEMELCYKSRPIKTLKREESISNVFSSLKALNTKALLFDETQYEISTTLSVCKIFDT